MNESITCIKFKALKKGRQDYFDHYLVATDLYNSVIYDGKYELLEHTLQYHYNFIKDLNKSLSLLEDVVNYVEMTKLESVIFETKHARLVMENYFFCQDMKELYELIEQQYFTLKTYGIMKGDDVNGSD